MHINRLRSATIGDFSLKIILVNRRGVMRERKKFNRFQSNFRFAHTLSPRELKRWWVTQSNESHVLPAKWAPIMQMRVSATWNDIPTAPFGSTNENLRQKVQQNYFVPQHSRDSSCDGIPLDIWNMKIYGSRDEDDHPNVELPGNEIDKIKKLRN